MTVDFSDTVHTISCDSTLISWDFGDGSNSSESNPTHTFNSSGTFNVCLEATNECGTTQICKPLTFIFNDIKDKNKQFITIHPNPASDYVNINFGEKNIYKLKLYDLFGRLIIEINEISASDFKLKTDFLTSGQYMLEISDESLITHKALIIK